MIVLDSDVLIEIFDRKSTVGGELLNKILESNEDISTTAVCFHEVLYGALKYSKPVKEIQDIPVLNYTKEDAELAARMELDAERKGKKLERADLMIAATVIKEEAMFFTLNRKHFEQLESFGLKLFK